MKRKILMTILAALSSLYGCSSDPNEPETPPQWENVSEHAIDTNGGTVENDEISIEIPPGAFDTEATIILQQAAAQDYPLEDPRLNALGTVFRLDGVPEFSEPLVMMLNFDPTALPAESSCFVYLEEECFVSAEGDWVQRGRPMLGSIIDRENGTVTVQLPAGNVSGDKLDVPIIRNFIITAAMANGFEAISTGGDFRVSWLRGQVDESWISDLVNALEDARTELEELGMNFTNSEGTFIEMHVRPLKGDLYGEFVQSKRGVDHSYLLISPTLTGDVQRATAGHELFHLLQMCYDVCGHYFGYDYVWLCEAASTWFEPVFMNNPDFISTLAQANRNFIFSCLETEDPKHGYGASRFLIYVTEKFGNDAITAIITAASEQGNDGTGVEAVEEVLVANGTTLNEEFITFARNYLTINSGHPDWTIPDYETLLLTPSQTSRQTVLQLPDLTARHVNTALNWGDETTWGKLTIAMNADASEHVKGFVYTAERGGGPWILRGEMTRDEAYVIPDFGRGSTTWIKIVCLRAEGVAPYNQSESVILNYSFSPQDGFPVQFAEFDLRLEGLLVSGESIGLGPDVASWNAVMLSADTFEIDETITGQPGDWVKHAVFRATIDFSNRVVTSWYYRSEFDNPDLEIHIDTMARGGEVEAYWQNEVSAQYRLRGQDVCDGLIEMTYVRTVDGVEEERLASPYCDIFSRLEITIRD